ncbi:MAG: hypothetical protein IPI84_11310 [Holophagaceae bacterium]|nr:hypothetical protein [Holophagaceae bacterium]
MSPRILSGLVAAFVLLATGCKDPDGATGGTTGAALYAYDSATSTVFVFSDVGSVYDGTATSIAPTKQITSSVFSSKISSLAWGGLCLDAQHAYLYLVSDSGNIVRVSNLRSQSGTVNSAEVVSFSLANTGRLSGSTFGQAALDPSTDTLYITENSGSGTQIWVVANASSQPQDASIALQALQMSGDSGGTGVAAGSGSVYAFMLDGSTVGTVVTYSGPRLRKGTASAFTDANTLIGSSTLLGKYGPRPGYERQALRGPPQHGRRGFHGAHPGLHHGALRPGLQPAAHLHPRGPRGPGRSPRPRPRRHQGLARGPPGERQHRLRHDLHLEITHRGHRRQGHLDLANQLSVQGRGGGRERLVTSLRLLGLLIQDVLRDLLRHRGHACWRSSPWLRACSWPAAASCWWRAWTASWDASRAWPRWWPTPPRAAAWTRPPAG